MYINTYIFLRIDSQRRREMLIRDSILLTVTRWTAGSRGVMGMMILIRVMSRSDRWYPSSSRRSWKETNAGNPGLEQEDGSERRRTEDEEDTLGMTQTVSISHNRAMSRERIEEWVQWCLNETGRGSALVLVLMKVGVMRMRWGAGALDWGSGEIRCGRVMIMMIGWVGGQTDPWHSA